MSARRNPAELVLLGANPRRRRSSRAKNPAELVVLAANPSKEIAAGEMYERFHGAAPQFTDDYHEPTPRPQTLTELGALLELKVKRDAGWKIGAFDVASNGIKLASNAAGTQLYCVGGDQKISRGQLSTLGVDNSKDLIDLGYCFYVAYRTRKAQVGGALASYEHRLGEETGRMPRLIYDRRGRQPRILFSGGEYHVEAEGIVN